MTVHAPECPTARSKGRVYGVASRIGAAPVALLLGVLMPLPVQGGRSLLGLPSLCLFQTMTGLPCPGCGMTRSLVCCCHLRFADSIIYHPLGPVVFIWSLAAALRRLPLPLSWRQRLPVIPLAVRAGSGIGLVLCLFLVWGARLCGLLPSPP
jgi:hypothetical protein